MRRLLSRLSPRWVLGLLGAVLLCNVLMLQLVQIPLGEKQRETDGVRQRAHEASDLALSLYRDREVLQERVRLLIRERDSLLADAATAAAPAEAGEPSGGGGGVERLLEQVRQRSGEMAQLLQRHASLALQQFIQRNQYPPSCSPSGGTRFMVCPVVDSCGFGCALHHAAYCFIAALSDNRTVVYAEGCAEEGRAAGWECYFEPVSSCHYADISPEGPLPQWRRGSPDTVTYSPFWSRHDRGPNFFAWASTDGDQTNDPFFIPQVAKDILGLVPHGEIGDLRAWFVGQLEKYMLRPNRATSSALREIHANLVRGSNATGTAPNPGPDRVGDWWRADWEEPQHRQESNNRELAGEWRHPIAAMHVRRTDHVAEAPFRSVPEYVARIESWWSDYCAKPENRHRASDQLRIYLATDEPRVIEEAVQRYPQFVFLTTNHGGRASGEGKRVGPAHTHNLLSDVFHLAKADFFVGTASSQVSRMAYERQQTYALNRHNWRAFVSLDAPWYFP